MAYSTLEDLKNRLSEAELIQLTDDAGAGAINQQLLTDTIAEVDDLIDQHLKGRVALPLAVVPKIISAISADLVLFRLHGRRSGELPEAAKEQQRNAMRLLERLNRGELSLGATTGSPATGGAILAQSGSAQIFTKDELEKY